MQISNDLLYMYMVPFEEIEGKLPHWKPATGSKLSASEKSSLADGAIVRHYKDALRVKLFVQVKEGSLASTILYRAHVDDDIAVLESMGYHA